VGFERKGGFPKWGKKKEERLKKEEFPQWKIKREGPQTKCVKIKLKGPFPQRNKMGPQKKRKP